MRRLTIRRYMGQHNDAMNDLSVIVDMKAPSERVRGVVFDVGRSPKWTPAMTIRRIDDGPPAVGSKAQVRQPRLLPAVWQVTELDEQRCPTWVTHNPGVRLAAEHRVEADGAGSRVTLSLRFSEILGPLISRLLRGCRRTASGTGPGSGQMAREKRRRWIVRGGRRARRIVDIEQFQRPAGAPVVVREPLGFVAVERPFRVTIVVRRVRPPLDPKRWRKRRRFPRSRISMGLPSSIAAVVFQ